MKDRSGEEEGKDIKRSDSKNWVKAERGRGRSCDKSVVRQWGDEVGNKQRICKKE